MIRIALCALALSAAVSPVRAQAVSVLVGGVRAEYADTVAGTAALVSGRVSGGTDIAAGVLEAGLSRFTTGEWTLQLAGYGTALARVTGTVSAGVAAGGDAGRVTGDVWSASGAAGPVVAAKFGATLLSAGASVGRLRRVDAASFAVGSGNLRARAAPSPLLVLEGGVAGVVSDSVRYADATGGVTLHGSRVQVSVSGGVRAGDLADGPWGSARIELAAAPLAVVEATVGRYPQELSGFTDGAYVSVGLRLNVSRASRTPWAVPAGDALRVERRGDGRVRVEIRYRPAGERLEIAGDWNRWTPEALRREGSGRWSIELRLAPGIYKYALLVDGETWVLPRGVVSVPDDLGGRVGLLVVR